MPGSAANRNPAAQEPGLRTFYLILGSLLVLDGSFVALNLHWVSGLMARLSPRLGQRRVLLAIGAVELALGVLFIYLGFLH